MKVRYTYRCRVGGTSERQLQVEAACCRWVWNRCVELDRAARAEGSDQPSAGFLDKSLKHWRAESVWLLEGSQNAQQQVIREFCTARTLAFQGRKRGKRGGRPRFHSRRTWEPSMNYTRSGRFGIRADGRLRLPNDIILRPIWSRELPSEPTSVRVFRDNLGRWWCSFVVDREVEPLPETGRTVGLDWGVTVVATTTDPAFDLPHTPHSARAQRAVTRYQRQMSRRRRARGQAASKGYKEAKRRFGRAHAKVAAQRQDEARKWAAQVVREFDQIAIEDFRPTFMLSGKLSARARSARIATARRALEHAAAKHGRSVVVVRPNGTTQTCHSCGAIAKRRLTLIDRTFACDSCGLTLGRDRNAALNVAARAGFDPAGVDRVRPAATLPRRAGSESQESPSRGGINRTLPRSEMSVSLAVGVVA